MKKLENWRKNITKYVNQLEKIENLNDSLNDFIESFNELNENINVCVGKKGIEAVSGSQSGKDLIIESKVTEKIVSFNDFINLQLAYLKRNYNTVKLKDLKESFKEFKNCKIVYELIEKNDLKYNYYKIMDFNNQIRFEVFNLV